MDTPLQLLRAALSKRRLEGFILPVNDEFMGEYVPACAKRLEWLTGFSGSAGLAIVLQDKAAFFTDGRYTLQAANEVKEYDIHNSSELDPQGWLGQNAAPGSVIGYDPKLHTLQALKRFEQVKEITLQPLSPNPIDAIWQQRPAAPQSLIISQPLAYAGESSSDKRTRIAKIVQDKKADALMLTAPDSICWLLNIRANDVPFTPFALAYALVTADAKVTLYLGHKNVSRETLSELGNDINIRELDMLASDFKSLAKKTVLYDPAGSPVWFYQQLQKAGAVVLEITDPCQLPKACKNMVEIDGMRSAHQRDGLAVTRFLCWLDGTDKSHLTEMGVAAKLEAFRKESNLYREPSFTTISGSGPNGAIVHYRVTPESNRKLDSNSMLLLDSGAQYQDGTTDITRTIALGEPSAEMKDRFTRVLKGHIALARAVFPHGTTGSQLDSLARQFVWQVGLDYDHGTGHGVGSYLSVHEGPQRISKRGGDAVLEAGMILSNEPGYYKAGEYGIRIENLVLVRDMAQAGYKKPYLGFETLTLAPIDLRLVSKDLLNKQEIDWLTEYHGRVCAAHTPHLTPAELAWLQKATLY